MALTQISTKGIKDAEVKTADIADENVTLAKLEHGTSGNNGKFLRANNGADPTWETVDTTTADDSIVEAKLDIHADPAGTNKFLGYTSNGMEWAVPPDTNTQVGGATGVDFNDGVKIHLGDSDELKIWHDSNTHSYITESGAGGLAIGGSMVSLMNLATTEHMFKGTADGSVELYYDGTKKAETVTGGFTVTGTCTATDFAGDGSNLTGISAGAALTGSTDNTVVTVTGANAMQGEANLTFTGSVLGLTGKMNIGTGMAAHDDANDFVISNNAAISGISINNADDGYGCLNFGDASDNDIGRIAYAHNGNSMRFHVNGAEKMRIKDGGNVTIEDGNLAVASGHGIDFGATSDASGKTSEVLDDYEEGTWTPADGGGIVPFATNVGTYTKVGNVVHCFLYIVVTANVTDTGHVHIVGLPFTSANQDPRGVSSVMVNVGGSGSNPENFQGWLVSANSTIAYGYKASFGATQRVQLWDGDPTDVSMWGHISYPTA